MVMVETSTDLMEYPVVTKRKCTLDMENKIKKKERRKK